MQCVVILCEVPPSDDSAIMVWGCDNMGFRFWDKDNRKVIRRRDITVNEDALYKDASIGASENKVKDKNLMEVKVSSDEKLFEPSRTIGNDGACESSGSLEEDEETEGSES